MKKQKLHCPSCLEKKVIKNGWSKSLACLQGRKRQTFRCVSCDHRFTQNVYSMSYRLKKADPALNAKILNLMTSGMSNRAIARSLFVSEECVRRRLERLSQRAFTFHSEQLRHHQIQEPIAFDGLENFAGSQYDPNNIQQAIGSESLFVYDFNFAPLNRKGRMSAWQKLRLREIESLEGRYDPKAIRSQSRKLFERLLEKSKIRKLELHTDEHFQYRRAIQNDLRTYSIDHKTVSSKACRNYQNILFSVNHMDLLMRQNVAAFTRETISFSKTPARMIQKFMLYVVHKNYMRTQFTKKHIRRPKAHLQCPAQAIGIVNRPLNFKDIFKERALKNDLQKLSRDWAYYATGEVEPECCRDKKFLKKSRAP